MTRPTTRLLAAALLSALTPALWAQAPAAEPELAAPPSTTVTPVRAPQDAPKPVDIAICLDTSGSMDGLIDSARQRLWDIVNDLATAKPHPALRVAVLSYGNDGYSAESGWVRVIMPFTTDLDAVSRELFALKTNGGTELVGRVVSKATSDLDWSKAPGLKLIVVAGNESADQDQEVSYKAASTGAIAKGIMVNAIYCGDPNNSESAAWREVATLADGQYFAIDQNKNEVIPTPHDAKLAELSAQLNTTYIPVGEEGRSGAANQALQDANAAQAAPAAAAGRAMSKSTGLYQNTWDLVDRVTSADEKVRVKLEDVKDGDLPENVRKMSIAERRAYVDEMAKKRRDIQAAIAGEARQREAFLDAERQKRAQPGQDTFESALRRAVRLQAQKQGFAWDK